MHARTSSALPEPQGFSGAAPQRSRWAVVSALWPYLWEYRARVVLALLMMIAAKVSNVGVPIVLKDIVDALDLKPGDPRTALVVPVTLLVAYGMLRLSVSLFTELREIVFSRVTQGAVRKIALQVFDHLFSLSMRYHLERQTGGMSRDMERGTRAISSLVSFTLYSILPTLVEMALVIGILLVKYDIWFAAIALAALALYVGFTITVTEWRTHLRREMNTQDSRANQRAIDALLNYETVKMFGNEALESTRYDDNLKSWMAAAIKSQNSLSLLNLGQSLIIATAVTLLVWRATVGVVDGGMNLGDVLPVDQNAARLWRVETKQQPRQRGLARTRRPDNGHRFPCGHSEIQPVQDGAIRTVAKAHLFEAHLAARHLQGRRMRNILDVAVLFQNREHAL